MQYAAKIEIISRALWQQAVKPHWYEIGNDIVRKLLILIWNYEWFKLKLLRKFSSFSNTPWATAAKRARPPGFEPRTSGPGDRHVTAELLGRGRRAPESLGWRGRWGRQLYRFILKIWFRLEQIAWEIILRNLITLLIGAYNIWIGLIVSSLRPFKNRRLLCV